MRVVFIGMCYKVEVVGVCGCVCCKSRLCLCVIFGCVGLLGVFVLGCVVVLFWFLIYVLWSGLTGFFQFFFFLLVGLVCGVVRFRVVCCVCLLFLVLLLLFVCLCVCVYY